jgi:hypothetical protein
MLQCILLCMCNSDSEALVDQTGVLYVVLQRFDETELDFQEKILYRSGLGDETYIPPCEWRPTMQDRLGRQRFSQHQQQRTLCCRLHTAHTPHNHYVKAALDN